MIRWDKETEEIAVRFSGKPSLWSSLVDLAIVSALFGANFVGVVGLCYWVGTERTAGAEIPWQVWMALCTFIAGIFIVGIDIRHQMDKIVERAENVEPKP